VILRDVAIHTKYEETSSLLAIISEIEGLSKKDAAGTERIKRTPYGGGGADSIEYVIHGWIDRGNEPLGRRNIE